MKTTPKRTEGPLKIVERKNGFEFWILDDHDLCLATAYKADGIPIDGKANAYLFAAAPELLKAHLLHEEYEVLMDAGDDVNGMLKYAEAQEARKAALKKVRGE